MSSPCNTAGRLTNGVGAHRLALALAIFATIALVPLVVRASGAGASLKRERVRAEAIVADVGHLEQLRAKLAASPNSSTDVQDVPAASLATRVSGVLSAAGLSQSNLAGLSPESAAQRSDAGTALRRRATLTLQSLTLRDLGRFIAEWRAREPAWVVTSIDLAPVTNANPPHDKPAPGADLHIRVVLVVETLSFDK
jgi:hypothetical protein